jgi:hypothetical protein
MIKQETVLNEINTGLLSQEIKSDQLTLDAGVKCERVQWTRDGQILTVATKDGELHGFLASLPLISASFDARVAHLTSLQELSIEDTLGQVRKGRFTLVQASIRVLDV